MTDSQASEKAQETAPIAGSADPAPAPWLTRLARRPFALLGFLGLILAIPLTCLGIAYYRRYILHKDSFPART